jgi:hypothetical protein
MSTSLETSNELFSDVNINIHVLIVMVQSGIATIVLSCTLPYVASVLSLEYEPVSKGETHL